MTIELLMTVWSIRVALLLFALSVVVRWAGHLRWSEAGNGWREWVCNAARTAWAAGCLLAVLHVVAVFGYQMNWSHRAAFEHTARQTQQSLGLAFGGGVYFNYVFLAIWVADAAWWCGWPIHYRQRPLGWDWGVIGYLWIIAFNATVVFESGATRWVGLLASLVMAATGFGATISRKRS